jgi:hypothetical protein
MDCKVCVKKYTICYDPPEGQSPYHYYIEIKTPNGKMIMDNFDLYNFHYYKSINRTHYTIQRESQRHINKMVKSQDLNIKTEVIQAVDYHFKNIKNHYKPVSN